MSSQSSSSVSCLFLGAQEDCQFLALERNASYLNTCYVNERDTKAFIVLRCYAAWYQKKVNSGKKNKPGENGGLLGPISNRKQCLRKPNVLAVGKV